MYHVLKTARIIRILLLPLFLKFQFYDRNESKQNLMFLIVRNEKKNINTVLQQTVFLAQKKTVGNFFVSIVLRSQPVSRRCLRIANM